MNIDKKLNSILVMLNPDNTLTLNRPLAFAIGANETLMYQALIKKYEYYSRNKKLDTDDWFYSTATDLQESTTFSTKVQKRLADNLVNLGLIEKKLAGMPRRTYYKIVFDAELLEDLINKGSQMIEELHNKRVKEDDTVEEKPNKTAQNQNDENVNSDEKKYVFFPTKNQRLVANSVTQYAQKESNNFSDNSKTPSVSTNGSYNSEANIFSDNTLNTNNNIVNNEQENSSIDQRAKQVSTNGTNKCNPTGETSIDQRANKTKVNKTKDIKPNLLNHSFIPASDGKQDNDLNERMNDSLEEIYSIIEYDYLLDNKLADEYMLDVIVSYMQEILVCTEETIRYGSNTYPVAEFKKRIRTYTYEHITELLNCYYQAENVISPKNYLIKMLYEKPLELEAKLSNDLYKLI